MRLKANVLADRRRPWREPPFSSPLSEEQRAGEYLCATCGSVLFKSAAKFFTSSGWPTFSRHVDGALDLNSNSRTAESLSGNCATCDSYIGEVFFDGPAPNKRRYAANGKSLVFRTGTRPNMQRA